MPSVNTNRIAKNTLLLYIRMLLLLVVSLYTSRIILKVLGIDDYGIYNLIAGFVTFLTFISNSLVSAMQRYFNVALGKNDLENYRDVFSMSINILALFSCLMLVLGETIGLWFVMNHLNIPPNRYDASIWVYQFSLLTFIANTLRIPFHASIIAHERMSFYAYISLIEVFLRLGMVYFLMIISGDHLIMYSIIYLFITILVNAIYIIYCRNNFYGCSYKLKKDRELFKDLVNFSGWTLMGQVSVVVKNQGEAIFINRFFSVAVNAAMGMATQVAGALELFVSNFQTAFNPQLIQSYASKNFEIHKKLLFRASKFSYFLLLIMLVPIVTNIDSILYIWLTDVPQYTNYFIVLILISYLFNAISNPFVISLFATGFIKRYQISLGVTFLSGLVIVYLALFFGAEPYSVSIVAIFVQFVMLVLRLYFTHKHVDFSYKQFGKDVLTPIIMVTILSIIPSYLLSQWPTNLEQTIIVVIVEFICTGLLILFVGMSGIERNYILELVKKKI